MSSLARFLEKKSRMTKEQKIVFKITGNCKIEKIGHNIERL